jgi:hypothetical protein
MIHTNDQKGHLGDIKPAEPPVRCSKWRLAARTLAWITPVSAALAATRYTGLRPDRAVF